MIKTEYQYLLPALESKSIEDLDRILAELGFETTNKTYVAWRWVKADLIFKAYPDYGQKICVQTYRGRDGGLDTIKLFDNFYVSGSTWVN